MLRFFNRISCGRTAWLLLAISVLLLGATALYFQHVMLLQPCVFCIYERLALFGILAAALIALIAPATALRYVALLLWLYSSWQGLRLSWQHTMVQLYPSPFATCEFAVSFPAWLPLDRWLPTVFRASGDCSIPQWQWLSLEMPQWLLIIFAIYMLIAVVVTLSQWAKPPRRWFGNN